jgi:hypothetical protein
MSLPPILASKFLEVNGFYIHRSMIDTRATTDRVVKLHDGRVFER